MASSYTPPGVTVTEVQAAPLLPLLATAASPVLVGLSSGAIQKTVTAQISGTSAVAIPGIPASSTLISVDAVYDITDTTLHPLGFSSTLDMTLDLINQTITRLQSTTTITGTISSSGTTLTTATTATTGEATPSVGDIVTITQSANTDIVTVIAVSGHAVTFTPASTHAYTSGAALAWYPMVSGHTFSVSYTYTPSDYFEAILMTNMTDVETRFGTAWNSQDSPTTGTPAGTQINSPLSFGASLAFQNGASSVVCQPLFAQNSSGVKSAPNTAAAAAGSTWLSVFNSLLDFDSLGILVPIVGQSQTGVSNSVMGQIEAAAQSFMAAADNESKYYVSVLGEDGTLASSNTTQTTLTANAQALSSSNINGVNEQTIFINTCTFTTPCVGGTLAVGGQYAAAAIAGMLAARAPETTITRQFLSGINADTDRRTLAQKNTDAGNGMLVLENKSGAVWVRHAISMDGTSAATREINVVRAKHFVIESLVDTSDQRIVGQVTADASGVTLVNALVSALLNDLQAQGVIDGFGGVATAIVSLDPTILAIQFTYQPIFVVNYVKITFGLDLTTGLANVTTQTSVTN